MPKTPLHPNVSAFLKGFDAEGHEGETNLGIFKLRDRLNKKQEVEAAAEIIKKNVRAAAKRNPSQARFGLKVTSACSDLFSQYTNSKALNVLVKTGGMNLVYQNGAFGVGVSIKF
jgi:hypothetical protein